MWHFRQEAAGCGRWRLTTPHYVTSDYPVTLSSSSSTAATDTMADFDMSTPPDILVQHVAPVTAAAWPSKPHVTLTWAQSLDAKIAGPGGKRVLLSGPESMGMTQW